MLLFELSFNAILINYDSVDEKPMTFDKEIPIDNINARLEDDRRTMVLRTIALLVVMLTIAIVVRYTTIGPHAGVFGIGLIADLFFIALYIALKRGFSLQIGSVILLVILVVPFAVLGYKSGGINGPVILLAPLVPLTATLLVSRLAGWLAFCAVGTTIIVLFALNLSTYEFPETQLNEQYRVIARGISLFACTLLITWIGWYYATMNRKMAQAIWEQATHDYLTGVANRRAIDDALQREIGRARRNHTWLSFIIADVDHFKRYNDINGHHAGDQCLVTIAGSLQACIKRSGDMVGRFGGEEFVAILPETEPGGALRVAETLRESIAAQNIHYKYTETDGVTITAGVTSFRGEYLNSIDEMIKSADDALYEGKSTGRNRVNAVVHDGENKAQVAQ